MMRQEPGRAGGRDSVRGASLSGSARSGQSETVRDLVVNLAGSVAAGMLLFGLATLRGIVVHNQPTAEAVGDAAVVAAVVTSVLAAGVVVWWRRDRANRQEKPHEGDA